MNTKLLVFDLDGTLLRSDSTLSERTHEALEQCRKKGIIIVIATARFLFKAQAYIDMIRPDYAILADGTLIFNGKELVDGCPLDLATTNQLIEALRGRENGADFVVCVGKDVWCSNREIVETRRFYMDMSEPIPYPAYKIASCFDTAEEAEALAKKYNCKLLSYRGESLYSFLNPRADKVSALEALGKRLGISLEEMVAFGDDKNDIEVLRKCGLGVAVGNAIPEVKQIAGLVVDTNDEDGVAKYIEEYLL